MLLQFYKYQGTGNDFVLIDNRTDFFPKNNTKLVSSLCDRHFGIGADGLILLENDSEADFKMIYYNSDGNPSSMCGNGGRCLVAFAKLLGIIEDKASFSATDGLHTATVDSANRVCLQMQDVPHVRQKPNYTFLDTGSPHHVQLVEQLQEFNVRKEGAKLRFGLYGQKGSNINFVEPDPGEGFSIRTYERGVENETLSCGTGVTAAALAMHHSKVTDATNIILHTLGGDLEVTFEKDGEGYKNVHLTGPAQLVFKGEIICSD
ncbi:diaminopimelate epimerase [Flavobacteriaceae bacterium TP-CH-4]|uniref:Diaminopimelate epimerase n=1 Tax=Pelagihabitans pacificus TaxID=2696054 RepID=A0A967E6M6_9FLAO|nr:diaminopimelate epimerase [Pelagihabitans pacificus]NHF59329.1 diaminopimelate epimerase [Pelagihabitans pacificus]